MKRDTGRPADLLDVEELEEIRRLKAQAVPDGSDRAAEFSFGGWEGHAEQERRAALQTTPAQRLEWLEEAIRFVHVVEARRASGELFRDHPGT